MTLKIFCIFVLTPCSSLCEGLSSTTGKPSRVSTPWSFRQPTALQAFDNSELPSADLLLKMVEDLTEDQFSPENVAKMSELEKVLSTYLDEENQKKIAPCPPGTPPPIDMFDQQTEDKAESLLRAEEALEILRERLRDEEAALLGAEEALIRSIEEDDVLRRAEEALRKSRAAAEKRKTEAVLRTQAAVASAEKARKEAEEDPSFFDDSARGTWGSQRATIPLSSLNGGNDAGFPQTNGAAPAGIPILYNWVQYVDGTIIGNVRGSPNFEDGASVSTSRVQNGATQGTVITTQSGSQYYLDTPYVIPGYNASSGTTTAPRNLQSPPPETPIAPAGIPSIKSWEQQPHGGIAGLVYNSPVAQDGDYIETSRIANGSIENGSIVETASGSRYFLSPEKETKEENTLAAFRNLAAARGTITIPNDDKEQRTNEALKKLENSKPRTTFSLKDLFGSTGPVPRAAAGSLGELPNGLQAPPGVPTLSRWNANDNGTVSGFVSGSLSIEDGSLVTTSRIVAGEIKRFQVVTTTSGSEYFLG